MCAGAGEGSGGRGARGLPGVQQCGRSQTAFSAGGLPVGASLDDLGKFTDALKAGKTPEEAIAGAMGHYGQWENAAKYIDPRTDEETHTVANVFPVHE